MERTKNTKLKKKEVNTRLIQTIEETLGQLDNGKALKKIRKPIKEAAKKITKEFYAMLKKDKLKDAKSSGTLVKGTNKIFIKNLKGKPTKDNIKEALKI